MHKDEFFSVVRAIIRNDENQVLLLKRTDLWEIPGGKRKSSVDGLYSIDWTEAAIKREVREETGMDLKMDDKPWNVNERRLPRFGWSKIYWTYYCTGTASGGLHLESGFTDGHFFSQTEIMTLPIAFDHREILTNYFAGTSQVFREDLFRKMQARKSRLRLTVSQF